MAGSTKFRPGFSRGTGPALPPRGPPFGVSSGAHIAVPMAGGRGSSWALCALSPRRRRLGAWASSRPVRALHPIGGNPSSEKFLQNFSSATSLKKELSKSTLETHILDTKKSKILQGQRKKKDMAMNATTETKIPTVSDSSPSSPKQGEQYPAT